MARRDYFYDPEAPKANSIRPAAAVALFDSRDNILLLRRKDNDKWTMPGGTLDFGESLTDCAIREVLERDRAADSNHGSNRHIHRSPHFDLSPISSKPASDYRFKTSHFYGY
jgi:ADP-ribose pyrophosphatase YjhB (NUDIX family)